MRSSGAPDDATGEVAGADCVATEADGVGVGASVADAVGSSNPTPEAHMAQSAWLIAASSPSFGVVGVHRQYVVVVTEDVLDEAVQGPFRADLDEETSACVVQRVQPFHELHGRGDLFAEVVEHRVGGGIGGIELARHVGDQWNARRAHIEALQGGNQRYRRGGHDRGVKGVADRDADGLHPGSNEGVDRCEHGVGSAADHGLVVGVDVGDHCVAGRGVDDPFDLGEWAEDRSHRSVVLDRQPRHFACRAR